MSTYSHMHRMNMFTWAASAGQCSHPARSVGSVAAQAGQGGNKGGDDEYAKFMREMQGLL